MNFYHVYVAWLEVLNPNIADSLEMEASANSTMAIAAEVCLAANEAGAEERNETDFVCSVSSFGFGGTNAHLLLQSGVGFSGRVGVQSCLDKPCQSFARLIDAVDMMCNM